MKEAKNKNENSKLLLDDYPILILPTLATTIGLNEAIILQQIHYWLQKSLNWHFEKPWVYNTYEEWKEQFPFWSVSTIKRTISNLENSDIVESRSDFNKMKIDKTKWYTINYDKLNKISNKSVNRPSGQNDLSRRSNWAHPSDQDDTTNNHRLLETSSETTKEEKTYGNEKSIVTETPFD